MKKLLWLVAVAVLMASCTPKATPQDFPYEKIISNQGLATPDLWRYVDEEYGVVIYIAGSGRMTSQPVPGLFKGWTKPKKGR